MEQINELVQRSKNKWAIFLFMIIIALVSGGGVYIWQQGQVHALKNDLEIKNNNLQNEVQRDQSVVEGLRNQIKQERAENSDLKDSIDKLKQQIAEFENQSGCQQIKIEDNQVQEESLDSTTTSSQEK